VTAILWLLFSVCMVLPFSAPEAWHRQNRSVTRLTPGGTMM
jgi:hypothetical protein